MTTNSNQNGSEWPLAVVLVAIFLGFSGCTASVFWASAYSKVEIARIAAHQDPSK